MTVEAVQVIECVTQVKEIDAVMAKSQEADWCDISKESSWIRSLSLKGKHFYLH